MAATPTCAGGDDDEVDVVAFFLEYEILSGVSGQAFFSSSSSDF